MMMQREFTACEKPAKEAFEKSSIVGVDLIEVCWTMISWNVKRIYGYLVPNIEQSSNNQFDARVNSDVTWVAGKVTFAPDKNGRCYGYIYDIPKNREKLYNCFNNDKYFIVNKSVEAQIKKEAEENGINTEPAKQVQMNVKKTTREVVAEKMVDKAKEDILKYEERVMELERALEAAQSKQAVQKSKPLGDVKLSNATRETLKKTDKTKKDD